LFLLIGIDLFLLKLLGMFLRAVPSLFPFVLFIRQLFKEIELGLFLLIGIDLLLLKLLGMFLRAVPSLFPLILFIRQLFEEIELGLFLQEQIL
jgi:hypothetical protein